MGEKNQPEWVMTFQKQYKKPKLIYAEYQNKYTEEFEVAAQALQAEVDKPIEHVRRGLDGLGFRGSLLRKNTVLAMASLCSTRFKYFGIRFPNLKSVIEDWQIGAELGCLQNDQSVLSTPVEIPKSFVMESHVGGSMFPVMQKIADIFSDSNGQESLRDDRREVILDITAWKWLQYCVLIRHGKSYPALTKEFSRKGCNPFLTAESLFSFSKGERDQYFALLEGYLVHGPEKWIKQYLMYAKKYSTFRLVKPNLIIDLAVREFSTVVLDATNSGQAIKKKTKSNQPLSERQLLKSDWYYPTPSEEQSIQIFFKDHLTDKGVHKDEALVLALSIATCRDVRDVMMLPFGWDHGIDAIVFKKIWVGDFSTEIAVWRKAEHAYPNSFAELQLVERITNILHPQLLTQGARKIHEIVDGSLSAHPVKCYQVLAQHMGITWTRAELILRNYLIRCIYDKTTNSALARFFQTGASLQKSRADQIALGHYVKIKGLRVTEPYHDACKKIMGGIGPRNNSKLVIDLGTKHIDPDEMKMAVMHFSTLLDSAKDSISKHNRFAQYTLLLMLAVTGHRKSVTPFYFPWDFSPENATVFISEKQSIGSEARFVPLCKIANQQLKKYIVHLDELVRLGTKGDKSEVNRGGRKHNANAQENPDGLPTEAIEHAQKLIRYFEINDSPQPLACHGQDDPEFSMFFLIDAETGKLKNMSTKYIDDELLKMCGSNFTGRLRATVAQHLWEIEKQKIEKKTEMEIQSPEVKPKQVENARNEEDGSKKVYEYEFGGREVQTFLGHHPEMHAFGPESALLFENWSRKVSPFLDKYVTTYDLIPRGSPFTRKSLQNISSSLATPAMHIGNASYEGRQLNTRWATEVIKKIIRKKLKEMLVTSEDMVMDQGDVDEIQESLRFEIRDKYPNDADIEKKLNSQLALELKKYHRNGQVNVTAASVNLVRSNPGPIDIEFSRALRISTVHHRTWCKRIGQPVGYAEPGNKLVINEVERYAHIAISLISLDSVLAPQRVESLIKTLLRGEGVNFYSSAITLRTHIVDKQFAADFSVILCPLTSALILSLAHGKSGAISNNTQVSWRDIEVRIGEVLRETLGAKNAGKEWTLTALCNIYKAFWHLRLPGTFFALAKGDFCGPAPTLITEHFLLAKPFEPPSKWLAISKKPTSRSLLPKKEQHEIAYIQFTLIFSEARGRIQEEQSTSEKQKKKLRSLLDLNSNKELNLWVDQQHVVELLVKFLWHLIEDGGLDKSDLAFSSIEKYFGMIGRQLMELAWDMDFETMGVQDYSGLYKKIEEVNNHKRSDCVIALKILHRCLVKQINAPYCKLWSGVFQPSQSRSSLLPAAAIETAINLLSDIKDDDVLEENRRCALLIACANDYGLRRNEVMGLDVRRFDAKRATNLFIQKNRIRDLKSISSRRRLVNAHKSGKSKRLIQAAIARADNQKESSNPQDRQYLFESTESKTDRLENVHATAKRSIEVLRVASGNDDVVLHDLRHTYATRILLQVFCQNPTEAITKKAITALFGDMDTWTVADEVLMAPENWMFVVDAVARSMGHAGIDTLLNTYFHGAYLAMANFTHGMVPHGDRTNKNLSALLNIEITKISRMQNEKLSRDAVIPFFINVRAELSANARAGLVPKKLGRPPGKFLKADQVPYVDMKTMDDVPWIYFERLLRYRLNHNCTFADASKHSSDELGIKAKFTKNFLGNYEALVKQGFVDYEHENSSIAYGKKSLSEGMLRSMGERLGLLKVMHTLYVADGNNTFRDSLDIVLRLWKSHLNADMPTLICTTSDEIKATLLVLSSLGADSKQLKFSGYGSESDGFIMETKHQFNKLEIKGSSYPSGGIKYQKNISIGIDVAQMKNSKIPDGRDLHRALVIASAASTQLPL